MEYVPSFRDSLQNRSEPTWRDDLSDELYHHGIKGMHWGVRRPRNEDGIIQGAGKGLFSQMKARHQRNKEAKKEYKAAKLKAKNDFKKFNESARKKAEKNIDYENSGKYDKELDAAIQKQFKANKSAKAKYKQTVNAEKIAKLENKRSKYQKAAGRDSAMRKNIKSKNMATRMILRPVSNAAALSQMANQHKANTAQRRIDRLSN